MTMLWFLFLHQVDASTKEEIKLLCLQPITGPIPDFGAVGSWAQQSLIDKINANPDLLPDYTLSCEFVDSGCNPGTAEEQVLGGFFTGDVLTQQWRTTPFQKGEVDAVQKNIGNVGSATYVGLIGPACSGATMAVAKFAPKAYKPIITHASTSPDLSDRTEYPYFWRAVQPDTAGLRAIGPTLAAMGVKKVQVFSGPTTDSFTAVAIEGLMESGVELVGGLPWPDSSGLRQDVAGFPHGRGLYFKNAGAVGEDVAREEAAQLISGFKQEPTRVIVASLYDDGINALLCEMDAAGIRGVIVASVTFMFKLTPEENAIWGYCDRTRVSNLLKGGLAFGPVFPRSDRGTVHGCIGSGVDPVDFLDELKVDLDGLAFFDYAAPSVDSVCVYAKALHELLYTDGYTVAQLNNMPDKATFEAFQAQIGAVDFEGTTGRVRYKYQGDEATGLPGPDPDLFLQEIVQYVDGETSNRVGIADSSGTTWSVTELDFNGFGGADGVEKYDFSAPVPLAEFAQCLGLELDFFQNQCVSCPPGAESSPTGCQFCRAGEFSDGVSADDAEFAGETVCKACKPGFFTADAGSDKCSPCPPGQVAESGGSEACKPCEAGSVANEDGTKCVRCAVGTYQNAAGQLECIDCNAGRPGASFITAGVGSNSKTDCVCEPGKFWNRKEDKCVKCPPETFCAGGTDLPLTYDGFWAEHVGDVSEETLRAQEVARAQGTYKPSPDAYSHTLVYKCRGYVCPGETMEVSTHGFAAKAFQTKKNVRVGFPLEGACAPASDPKAIRRGIACEKCEKDYFGTGENCKKCDGGAVAGSAILICLVPFIMVCIYRGTTSSGTQRVQAAFILVSTCGMGAFFMQTIAVFSTFSLDWPKELEWLFEIAAVFMFDLNNISVSCFHGPDFAGKYWATILLPMFVIVCTAIGYAATKVLPVPEPWKMQPNHTFSMLGMLLTALYITLVKVVVAYWECVDNPAAEPTLAKYKDVVCDSKDHKDAIPAMAIGLVFYVLGFYLAFLHAAYVAPKQWMNVGFRERWKFMLTRWRPDTYYWGSVMMTRNMLVAFAGIISDQPRVQLTYVVCVVVIGFAFVAVYQPWRAMMLNHYDVASCIVLTFIGVFGIIFVSLDKEIQVSEQNDLEVEGKRDELMTFATVLSALVAIFLALFGGLVCWCVAMVIPSQMQKQAEAHDKECKELTALLHEKVASNTFKDESARLIQESTNYDRYGLRNFLVKIDAEKGTHKDGTTDTISINKAKAASPNVVSA